MTPSSNDRIAIACAADAAWVMPLAAMVQSVLSNNRSSRPVDLYVLAGGIDQAQRDRLGASWAKSGATTHWLDPRDSHFAGVPLWGRMPVTTYYKLAVSDLLPAATSRAIWLDTDVIVEGDISRLWESKLGGKHVLAAQDRVVPLVSSVFGLQNWRAMGLERNAKYFNAGVMLVDLERWRGDGIAEQVVDYLRRHHREVYFWDQDGLNAVLAGRWGELDEAWNYNVSVPGRRRRSSDAVESAGEGADDGAGPWILHYTGHLKPWAFPSSDPRRQLFFKYLDQTEWSGWRPKSSLAGRLIDFYEASGIRRFAYPAERYWVRVTRALSRRAVPDLSQSQQE